MEERAVMITLPADVKLFKKSEELLALLARRNGKLNLNELCLAQAIGEFLGRERPFLCNCKLQGINGEHLISCISVSSKKRDLVNKALKQAEKRKGYNHGTFGSF
jgi:hypothetical protein